MTVNQQPQWLLVWVGVGGCGYVWVGVGACVLNRSV